MAKQLFKQTIGLLAIGLICLTYAVYTMVYVPRAKAEVLPSPWLSTGEPGLETIHDLAPNTVEPYYGHQDCTEQKLVIRPERTLTTWPFYQSELTSTQCVTETPMGSIGSSHMQLNGTSVAGLLRAYNGYGSLLPVHNSTTIITYSSAPWRGVHIAFTKNAAFTPTVKANGEVSYQLNKAPDRWLRSEGGGLMSVMITTRSTSENGQWMAVDVPYHGIMRINLETFETLLYAPSFNYDIGIGPVTQTAITSDGRYAIRGSRSFSTFRLYDLSTCKPSLILRQYDRSQDCSSVDLYSFMKRRYPEFIGLSNPRFTNNHSLEVYVTYKENGMQKVSQVLITAPGAASTKLEYLGMGDSFASGEGAYLYKSGTDTKQNKCHNSTVSYPYLIAKRLGLNTFNSIACSGAVINDVISESRDYNIAGAQAKGKELPEFDKEIYQEFLPGYRAQHNFVNQNQPRVVTISAIGNDLGFSNMVRRCVAPNTCYGTYEDRLELVRHLKGKIPDMVRMYSAIKRKSAPNAKVYVLGYPQMAAVDGNCGINVRLNNQEIKFFSLFVSHLNMAVKQAASTAGVTYVDVEDAFYGNRLCELTAKKNFAVNGLTAGNDIFGWLGGPIGNESYHPNQLGHRLFASRILGDTRNFTVAAPTPALSTTEQKVLKAEALLSAPRSGRTVYSVNFDNGLSNNVAYRQSWLRVTLKGIRHAISPRSVFGVVLNSEPVDLGNVTADDEGNISSDINIPESVPTGFHTLHFYGTNMAGEPIDIYKTIYVAASENDLDGDGVPNSEEKCLAVEPANVDEDRDGTDDACDGEITEPPADTTPPVVTGTPDPKPNTAGWHKSEVTIGWSASDPEPSSGAATQPTSTVADKEGEHLYTSAASCDPAGNCATGSLTIKLDKTTPEITTTISSAANVDGWHNSDVTVTPACSDSLSGIANCTLPTTLTNEGTNQIVISEATDRADNTASAVHNIHIDKTAPLIGTPAWTSNPKESTDSTTLTLPADDNLSGITEAEYFLGETDPGPGNGAIMTLNGGNLATTFGTDFPTGVWKVSVRAKDKAGNWSAPVSDYLVVYNPDGLRMTGKKTVLPAVSNGDILPGLASSGQSDMARFGFSVRYDKQGQIHKNSDFQFSYKTGTNCKDSAQAQNCHVLELNSTSIDWLTTQGPSNTTGIFQGTATLKIDGIINPVGFRVYGLDGERHSANSSDYLTVLIFRQGDNPHTATPLYRLSAPVDRGTIRIRTP